MKISHLEKSVILDTIFDFWLTLHTQTICLRSCYHVCSRNFYVTCIPFAHQHIWKVQSVIRYPVLGRIFLVKVYRLQSLSVSNKRNANFTFYCQKRLLKLPVYLQIISISIKYKIFSRKKNVNMQRIDFAYDTWRATKNHPRRNTWRDRLTRTLITKRRVFLISII